MSALQKQLLAKRTGRVANKTKKVLAMMEEETVIGDPHDKVKLLKHKKVQVRSMGHLWPRDYVATVHLLCTSDCAVDISL